MNTDPNCVRYNRTSPTGERCRTDSRVWSLVSQLFNSEELSRIMDLFRKHKKKQAAVAALGTTKGATPALNTSYTDQLDQIAISAAEMETEAAYNDSSNHEPLLNDNNLVEDVNENSRSSDKLSAKSAIDALLDSDDDNAEIFNDLDGSSGDDNEDDVGTSSLLGTPTSKRSTVSSKALAHPASALTSTSIMAISPLSATSSVASKNPKSSFHTDLFDVLQSAMDVTIGSNKEDKIVQKLNETAKDQMDGSEDDPPNDEDESMSNFAEEDNNDDPDNDEKTNSDSAEDYSDDEDEGEDGYKPGGYHPVKVGEIYNQRYVALIYNYAARSLLRLSNASHERASCDSVA